MIEIDARIKEDSDSFVWCIDVENDSLMLHKSHKRKRYDVLTECIVKIFLKHIRCFE